MSIKPGTNFLIHIAYPVALKHAINSAYIVDDVTTDCLALFHDIAPPASKNTYPDVDFKVSLHPARSASE